MHTLRLALDWTPNTNHTGFFVAQANNYYSKAGLALEILNPGDDNYKNTPAKKLELGFTDLAIAPSESVISYRTKKSPVKVKAIAAILQKDASAITTLAHSNIDRPADLDGRVYASYDARYEDKIVQQMIRNDGGEGEIEISNPAKLGIWNTLVEGNSDATWIFLPWEGVEAEQAGLRLQNFTLDDYGIPYGYSPILMAKEEDFVTMGNAFTDFISQSRRGFEFARRHPEEAAEIMKSHVPQRDQENIDLLQSQKLINTYYVGKGQQWGEMNSKKWNAFVEWLHQHSLIDPAVKADELFTNRFT